MTHRHLNHETLTLAAIDDVIARGRRADWQALRAAVLDDPQVRDRVRQVSEAGARDPRAQRYHFWKRYADGR